MLKVQPIKQLQILLALITEQLLQLVKSTLKPRLALGQQVQWKYMGLTNMTKPMVRIHNQETNEIIDREMTDAEFAQYEADQAIALAKAQAEIKAAEAKAALLDRLGITADEAKLLLS